MYLVLKGVKRDCRPVSRISRRDICLYWASPLRFRPTELDGSIKPPLLLLAKSISIEILSFSSPFVDSFFFVAEHSALFKFYDGRLHEKPLSLSQRGEINI